MTCVVQVGTKMCYEVTDGRKWPLYLFFVCRDFEAIGRGCGCVSWDGNESAAEPSVLYVCMYVCPWMLCKLAFLFSFFLSFC